MISIRNISILSVIAIFCFSSCSTLQNTPYIPSDLENITAIKEILNGSSLRALNTLAQSSEHGIEGLLPDEVKPVITTLKTLGLGDEINALNKKVGVVSEAVLLESKSLMEDAIYQVDIKDAPSIIMGNENAATAMLKGAMYGAVKSRYSKRLDGELSKINETKHWDTAVTAYNIFAKNKIKGSLSDFIAEKAVDAVFVAMSKEEAAIRQNPASLEKEVVTKVFNYYRGKNL